MAHSERSRARAASPEAGWVPLLQLGFNGVEFLAGLCPAALARELFIALQVSTNALEPLLSDRRCWRGCRRLDGLILGGLSSLLRLATAEQRQRLLVRI